MKTLNPRAWRLVAGGLAATGLVLAVLLGLALDAAPSVQPREDIAVADVAHALAVARQHDPRRAVPGQPAWVQVNESDLELLLNHAAQRALGMRVRLVLEPGEAQLSTSAPLSALWPGAPLGGRWLNLQATLAQADGLPVLRRWRVGALPLPAAWAGPLLNALSARQDPPLDLSLPAEVVRQVRFGHDALDLQLVWTAATTDRLLSLMTPPAQRERLRAYSDLLVSLTHRQGAPGAITMPELVGPVFDLARQRSLTHDPAHENRAALLTLALYATGQGLDRLVPAARSWPQPRRMPVLLGGRDDFSMHFLVSAALAAESSSPFTQAVGLYKEVADTQGGSGFSFNDLAVNRAGMRFGELALREPARLQDLLARGVPESALLPEVRDLPEFLSAAEFRRRYGQVGSPVYRQLIDDIERRVNALPLYR